MLAQGYNLDFPNVPDPPPVDTSQVPPEAINFVEKIFQMLNDPKDYIAALNVVTTLNIILLIAVGFIALVYGWKLFKVLVVLDAAALGAIIGASLLKSQGQNAQIFGAVAGALLLAAIAWPLLKYAVAVLGAIAGGFLGYGVWNYVVLVSGRGDLSQYAWVGGLIGLIALGLLAFAIFRTTVMIIMSLQGSFMLVSGVLAALMVSESLRPKIEDILQNPNVLPLLLIVTAAIGFILQQTVTGKKKKKKDAAAA